MVKYIAGGLLFSAGVEGGWDLPQNFRPMFGYRSDNSHCCETIVLSGSTTGIDGTYYSQGESGGRKYYVSSEGNQLTGANAGLWLFQNENQSGTDGLVGYFTNNQCVINEMVSTDDWKELTSEGEQVDAPYVRVTCATDVDECRLNPCPSGTCVDTVGGFDCIGTTHDWNQCDDNGGAVCRPNSSCVEENPGYSCACDSGFFYNNNTDTCDDVNDCANKVCGTGADVTCTEIPGSYECGCVIGYVAGSWANGACEDENECDTPYACASNTESSCFNLDGDFECQCNAGFHRSNAGKKTYTIGN